MTKNTTEKLNKTTGMTAILVVLSVFFGSSAYSTDVQMITQKKPQIVKAPPIQTQRKYNCTGHSCTYNQANENISVISQYKIEKYKNLKKRYDMSENYDSIRKDLPGFCLGLKDEGGNLVEDDKACFKRYERILKVELTQARKSMITNKDNEAALNHDAPKIPVLTSNENAGNVEFVLPNLPRFESLDIEYRQKPREKDVSQIEYQKWVRSLSEAGLDKNDFPAYDESGKILKIKRDSAGNTQYEDNVYNKLKFSKEDEKAFQEDLQNMMRESDNDNMTYRNDKRVDQHDFSEVTQKSVGSVSYDAYSKVEKSFRRQSYDHITQDGITNNQLKTAGFINDNDLQEFKKDDKEKGRNPATNQNVQPNTELDKASQKEYSITVTIPYITDEVIKFEAPPAPKP